MQSESDAMHPATAVIVVLCAVVAVALIAVVLTYLGAMWAHWISDAAGAGWDAR